MSSCISQLDSKVTNSVTPEMPTVSIIGFPVTALLFHEQIEAVLQWANASISKAVCVANTHMLVEAHKKPQFGVVLKTADLVTPDGMPLVWVMKMMGAVSQNRVAGMDIFLSLCDASPRRNISIYFLGAQSAVLTQMRSRLKVEFPNLDIAGMEPLPFRPLTVDEDEHLIQRVNDSGAGLVFLALGCPKQEKWIAAHKDRIRAVMIGLGGVFPVYAGIQKRAPRWVRDAGLEWLYRLLQEPKRLWKRYGTTIPPFMCLAFRQVLMQKVLRWR